MNTFAKLCFGLATTVGSLSANVANAALLDMNFKKGEMICIISSSEYPSQRGAVQQYFNDTAQLIESENVEFVGSLQVEKVLLGQHPVPGFGFVKLPSKRSKVRLYQDRLNEWQHIRETRPDIWKELRLNDFELQQDTTFSLDTEKYYQLESFWVKQDKENEFDTFLNQDLEHRRKVGGRIVQIFGEPDMYDTLGVERAPNAYLITEWDSKEAFNRYWGDRKSFRYLSGHDAWLTRVPALSKPS